jgi:hypothetical protein
LCHNQPVSKAALIKARVTPAMKLAVEQYARDRGESEAVIVREALKEYFRTRTEPLREQPVSYRAPSSPKKSMNPPSPP